MMADRDLANLVVFLAQREPDDIVRVLGALAVIVGELEPAAEIYLLRARGAVEQALAESRQRAAVC